MTQLNHIVNKCHHNLRIGESLRAVHQQMIVKRLQKTGMSKIEKKKFLLVHEISSKEMPRWALMV